MSWNLICIAVIIVFIIDLSGFVNEMKYYISKWLTKGKIASIDWDFKPFTCSLCMTFWTGLIYIACLGSFTPGWILFVCVLALLTPVIGQLLLLIKDLITMILNKIENLL